MKVNHVLMITAVLLVMLVAPVAAVDDQELTIGLESDAVYSFTIPVSFNFASIDAGAQANGEVSVEIIRINPNHVVNVSVTAGDDDWYLKHVDNDRYRLQYEMTVDGKTMVNDAVVLSAVVNDTKNVVFTLKESATKSGRYEDTLTFTAVMEKSTSILDVPVDSHDAAQTALDEAVPGTIIRLQPGVDYGTLLVRPVMGATHTQPGDWFTGNYATELARTIEDVTIIGAEGATVDAIVFDAGYKEDDSSWNYINIMNLVIDSVEFTDDAVDTGVGYNSPIFINLQSTNLNGLTVKNCELIGDNEKTNFVYIYKDTSSHDFPTASKNVKILDNTVDGIARLCELRGTENVEITGNTIKNTAMHGILLAGSGYSGDITITGNTADSIKDRLVRMSGAGAANVVIKDNSLTNYLGSVEDSDFIKVDGITSAGSVTKENNIREIYGLNLICDYGDNSGTIVVSDKEGLLNLPRLFDEWDALFCIDPSNPESSNFPEKCYYYDWGWDIVLTADIDFENAEIAPINLGQKNVFDGQDHTIKNAIITTDTTTQNEAGLFVGAQCGFKNLKLDNIIVTGSNEGNSCVGVLSGSCNKAIDGIIITNSKATNGKYTGGVVGYGYTKITNCHLTNVEVKGGYKLGGIIGYICASNDNTGDVTGNSLTDCTVDGLGSGVFAAGKDKYIIGKVVGNYNCNGECKDNTITRMTTTAAENIGQIENGKTVTEQ